MLGTRHPYARGSTQPIANDSTHSHDSTSTSYCADGRDSLSLALLAAESMSCLSVSAVAMAGVGLTSLSEQDPMGRRAILGCVLGGNFLYLVLLGLGEVGFAFE